MTNQILLAAIALGVWANVAVTFTSRPTGQDTYLADTYLGQIATATKALADGGRGCRNTKICD